MKKLLLIFLLFSSLTHALTINLELNITGHETVKKQLIFNDPKETTWRVDAGDIIISGTIPNPKLETALIAFNIFVREKDQTYNLICSPSINATWDKKAEIRIAAKEADIEKWQLSLDVIVTRETEVS